MLVVIPEPVSPRWKPATVTPISPVEQIRRGPDPSVFRFRRLDETHESTQTSVEECGPLDSAVDPGVTRCERVHGRSASESQRLSRHFIVKSFVDTAAFQNKTSEKQTVANDENVEY